jgi:hypothetical protein
MTKETYHFSRKVDCHHRQIARGQSVRKSSAEDSFDINELNQLLAKDSRIAANPRFRTISVAPAAQSQTLSCLHQGIELRIVGPRARRASTIRSASPFALCVAPLILAALCWIFPVTRRKDFRNDRSDLLKD